MKPPTSHSKALVELVGVTHIYNRRDAPALVDVDLTIEADSFIGIVGPSGSGKTTLLRLVAGAISPSSGIVSRAPHLSIGFVPQVETVNWSFPVTALEIALMARVDRRLPWISAGTRAEAAEIFELLGIEGMQDRHIRTLSGGQQQRVFIARALLSGAQLLLLDEPTSGIDARTRHDVLHLLGKLHANGLAIMLTTHDLNSVAAHLPRLVCLNRSVVAAGEAADLLLPEVLEATYGAPMDVLYHAGMPVVIERSPLP